MSLIEAYSAERDLEDRLEALAAEFKLGLALPSKGAKALTVQP